MDQRQLLRCSASPYREFRERQLGADDQWKLYSGSAAALDTKCLPISLNITAAEAIRIALACVSNLLRPSLGRWLLFSRKRSSKDLGYFNSSWERYACRRAKLKLCPSPPLGDLP